MRGFWGAAGFAVDVKALLEAKEGSEPRWLVPPFSASCRWAGLAPPLFRPPSGSRLRSRIVRGDWPQMLETEFSRAFSPSQFKRAFTMGVQVCGSMASFTRRRTRF